MNKNKKNAKKKELHEKKYIVKTNKRAEFYQFTFFFNIRIQFECFFNVMWFHLIFFCSFAFFHINSYQIFFRLMLKMCIYLYLMLNIFLIFVFSHFCCCCYCCSCYYYCVLMECKLLFMMWNHFNFEWKCV